MAVNGNSALREIFNEGDIEQTHLVEVAWEACNQVGGIYTVIRSKAETMTRRWGDNYCLVGPYIHEKVDAIFEPIEDYSTPIGQAVAALREKGLGVHYGTWLVSGRPQVVLLDPNSVRNSLGEIKYLLWDHHNIKVNSDDPLIDDVVAWGEMVKLFFSELSDVKDRNPHIVAHFHEWMAATSLPEIRRLNLPIGTVFTTHATLLGRYLAMNDPNFYDHLHSYDWEKEAQHFNVQAQAGFERCAAHGCHVFTTVSDVTARECVSLLGRQPDAILPNGINIDRFAALHEFQNLHQQYKQRIHNFVTGHFFQNYTFDLDNTLYFFTSGRFEYHNKGFDVTLEALARLNHLLKEHEIDKTVMMFFITKQPYTSINADVLQSRAVMHEIQTTCDAIQKQVGERLFYATASGTDGKMPNLNDLVDDYWRLRLRRTIQTWKTPLMPPVVTHDLVNDSKDQILDYVRKANLLNYREDKVKIVYHPDFISPTSPLFGMEYGDFVRGCHLGIFPSYYEPWGYTPLECMASGVPSVTSDLSGFGDYALKNMADTEKYGIGVIHRNQRSFDDAADQLAQHMLKFAKQTNRARISKRNRVENASVKFDWKNLSVHYDRAHKMAIDRAF